MRLATPANGVRLVELMAEFYAEARYSQDRPHATRAFETLLANERLGYAWLIEAPDGQVVGHLVLTWCFSMDTDEVYTCTPAPRGLSDGTAKTCMFAPRETALNRIQ